MRSDSTAFQQYTAGLVKRPRYVVQISFDTSYTDLVYFTSHPDADYPAGATVYQSTVAGISGTTQRIDPLRGNSTIGEIILTLSDVDEAITTLFGTKLQASKGLRGKRVRVYKGAEGMSWFDYTLVATQIVKRPKYRNGAYVIQCADIQRGARKDIFITATTTLTQTIPGREDSSYAATGATINVADTSSFSTYAHGTSYTDGTASTTCGYVKIEDEIIMYTGKTSTTFTGCSRGWLGTRPARHEIDASASNARKTVVEEFVYVEMSALKLAYALLTGTGLPANWCLSISTDYIDDAAFLTAHPDLYNSSDESLGFQVRFAGEKRTDGKAFIEQQLMMPMAGFMPVLSTGELSFRRMTRILSNAGYVARFDASNVVEYGELEHAFEDTVNTVAIDWNYDHISGKSTRRTALVDTNSITAHGASPPKLLNYRGLYGNTHTDATIAQVFDSFIDRYSRPPLKLSVSTLHTQNAVEVGDVVRVVLDEVRDMTGDVATSVSLNRSFEVQQVSINWITGETSFELFGSSGAGTAIARTANASDLNDTFYTSGLASNREINVANCGAAYSAGTLTSFAFTGHADATNSAAIWWHDGNLTIEGACTWTNNIQLRVKGTRTLNGSMTAVGQGCAGGASATAGTAGLFTNDGAWGLANTFSGAGLGWVMYAVPGGFTRGTYEGLPPFNLVNDGGVLKGIPTDLRGSGGGGGGRAIRLNSEGTEISGVAGGAGGAGGGGLIEIARAFVQGANAVVNTSGSSGSVGSTLVFPVNDDPDVTAYAGSGAGGSPGGWLAILDGSSVNTPDASVHIANSGTTVYVGTEVSSGSLTKNYPGQSVRSDRSATPSESYSDEDGPTAFRFMRVPENTSPEEDVPLTTSIPTALNVVESTNTPQTPAENLATLTVTATAPSDGNYSHSNIYYRVSGSGKPYVYAGPADNTFAFTTAMDGTAYEVIAKPVSIFGVESDEARRTTITTTNAKGGVNLAASNWIASGQTAYDTGTGFYMINDGGTPKFSIGNSAGNKMTWNGSTLAITGTVTATAGAIGGWTINSTTITNGAGTITLDSSNNLIQLGSGASDYVRLTPTAIIGVSAAFGTTFNLPTNGGAPTFSSGVINFTEFNVSSAGIIRTSATVGDGGMGDFGVLIDDTGVKGFEDSNATPTFHLDATNGSITAKKGSIAGWTLSSTTLANGSDIILDASNKAISIKSATWQSDGVQIQYNSGNPRAYIGDGSNKYFQFDGTDVSIGRDSKLLGADAYNNDNFYWSWSGDSYDFFSKSTGGSGTNSFTVYHELTQSVTTGASDSAIMTKYYFPTFTTWGKNRRVKFYYSANGTPGTNQTIEVGTGNAGALGEKLAFRIKPSSLAVYGVSRNSSETELDLSTTISSTTYYLFEIVFTSGTKAEFFIDGVSKGSITTNLPSGTTDSESLFKMTVINSAASSASFTHKIAGIKAVQDP